MIEAMRKSLRHASVTTLGLWLAATAAGVTLPPTNGPTVRRILLDAKDIFDPSLPGERRWPFTWGNALHIRTKEQVIRREVLLRPGDLVDPILIEESERNLRRYRFIKRADIEQRAVGENQVDLIVHTQDTWTTSPQASFDHEGGQLTYKAGLRERNLLGYGKTFSYFYDKSLDRRSNELHYDDPRLLGTWARLQLALADTSDGSETSARLERPFYSLRTPWAIGGAGSRVIRKDQLFQNAAKTSEFNHDQRGLSVSLGRRVIQDPLWPHRLTVSYQYQEDRFSPTSETAAATLPANRTLSGPSVGYSWTHARFIKETYLDRMERVEDVNLGNEAQFSLGYAPTTFGSHRTTTLFSIIDSQGGQLDTRRFLLGQAGMVGRAASGGLENTIAFGNVNLFIKQTWRWPNTTVLHLEGAYGHALDGENQLELGGNTGLRGYKVRALTGNKAVLLNLEHRVAVPYEFFHLLRVGGAAFLDMGAIQVAGQSLGRRDFRTDVGVGLRMSPTRSTRGTVARIDFAWALSDSPGTDRRLIITIKAGQAFGVFNNTLVHALPQASRSLEGESAEAR
ncbi:MAG: BamA/TamA family outer membrane protein [Elusimicrobia bacterium]|nr:BamA/TamA family outer membrane protein [Elusimicrobiota bacterium]